MKRTERRPPYLTALDPSVGSEAHGCRPCNILRMFAQCSALPCDPSHPATMPRPNALMREAVGHAEKGKAGEAVKVLWGSRASRFKRLRGAGWGGGGGVARVRACVRVAVAARARACLRAPARHADSIFREHLAGDCPVAVDAPLADLAVNVADRCRCDPRRLGRVLSRSTDGDARLRRAPASHAANKAPGFLRLLCDLCRARRSFHPRCAPDRPIGLHHVPRRQRKKHGANGPLYP